MYNISYVIIRTKRVLIIFTGGTIAGNVAKSDVSQDTKSDPNSFLNIVENSIDIVKKLEY